MRRKQRIYTERDWKAADGLDRLYIHLMEPERWVLSELEETKLEGLRTTWKIICQKSRQRERLLLIAEMCQVTERTAYRYMQDAVALFGETLHIDHDLELHLAYERYLSIHEAAKKEEDWDNARRALDSAMGVRHEIEARVPKDKKVYTAIIFTSDPSALRARNDDAETLDFDELPAHATESVLERQAIGVPAGD